MAELCFSVDDFILFFFSNFSNTAADTASEYDSCGHRRCWTAAASCPYYEQQRSSEQTTCASHSKLSINLLELLAMVVTAYVMVVVKEDRPSVAGEPVLIRGDSSSAVSWVNRCGGTRDPRAAFIMRWLGVLEVNTGW